MDKSDPAVPRELFVVNHASANDCLTLLSELDLGVTVTKTLPDALELTGSEGQIDQAGAVLDVIDVNEPCAVLALGTVTQARSLPSNEAIARALGGVTIGTFAEPPAQGGFNRVIIDIHKDKVVAIGPRRLMAGDYGARP